MVIWTYFFKPMVLAVSCSMSWRSWRDSGVVHASVLRGLQDFFIIFLRCGPSDPVVDSQLPEEYRILLDLLGDDFRALSVFIAIPGSTVVSCSCVSRLVLDIFSTALCIWQLLVRCWFA